jgi:hypothetical protein
MVAGVEEDERRLSGANRFDRVAAVAALSDHRNFGIIGEQDAQVLARQRLIVDDQRSDLLHHDSSR